MNKEKMQRAHNAVANALGNLADTVFTKGVKLSFVMRMPGNDDCYMVITDDNLDDIIATVERSRNPAHQINAEKAGS